MLIIMMCFHLCNTFNYSMALVFFYMFDRSSQSWVSLSPFFSLLISVQRLQRNLFPVHRRKIDGEWFKLKWSSPNLIYDSVGRFVGWDGSVEGGGGWRRETRGQQNYDNVNYFVMHKLWVSFDNFFHSHSPFLPTILHDAEKIVMLF